jgi:hypothetical protein
MLKNALLIVALIIPTALPVNAAPIKIEYDITPIAQPSLMSCWAAATTILKNWKLGFQRFIEDVVSDAGSHYLSIHNDSFNTPPTGISRSDEKAFYAALGLSIVQGLNPTIEGWGELLEQHGPLSVAVDANPGQGFIHALVVTGLDGDGTAQDTIISYVDPDGGVKKQVWLHDFFDLYKGSVNWPLQIIYNP